MTAIQRVIKYLAIALAIFIILSIFNAIIGTGEVLTTFLLKKQNDKIVATKDVTDEINTLEIDLKYASLEIIDGEEFKVDTTSNIITIDMENNKLVVKDNNNNKFNTRRDKVIIYKPQNTIFEKATINNGAGSLNISSLITNNLNLELGVGKTTINYIEADIASIETGLGSLEIKNCILNNTDINVGVGSLIINGILTGNSSIESGVGETRLDLIGSKDDYKLEFNKGIGSIKYNEDNIKDNTIIGNGNNYIKIDGGIGAIIVKTIEIKLD